jgi:hypothetical protein
MWSSRGKSITPENARYHRLERAGAAYAFRFDGWHWAAQAKLLAADGPSYDMSGCLGARAVAVCAGTAAISAFWDDDNGADAGSAHVFQVRPCLGDIGGDNDFDLEPIP